MQCGSVWRFVNEISRLSCGTGQSCVGLGGLRMHINAIGTSLVSNAPASLWNAPTLASNTPALLWNAPALVSNAPVLVWNAPVLVSNAPALVWNDLHWCTTQVHCYGTQVHCYGTQVHCCGTHLHCCGTQVPSCADQGRDATSCVSTPLLSLSARPAAGRPGTSRRWCYPHHSH